MSTRDTMFAMDAEIAQHMESVGLLDTLQVGSIEVKGYYLKRFVSDGGGEDEIRAYAHTFDCRESDVPTLVEDDEVTVVDEGTFRYLGTEPNGTGRVLLMLGVILP